MKHDMISYGKAWEVWLGGIWKGPNEVEKKTNMLMRECLVWKDVRT